MKDTNQSLAVKYRPKTFEEVCGQSVVVTILEKAVATRKFKNCYLFAGSSGCGKTTLARIFANKINNGEGEPIEIDGASNNGVDAVKTIIEDSQTRSLFGEYKIYIIDECHAITKAGWQAFLKGIEEPSPYTIFMFCTTEPNKIPEAILNRVQRYNISSIDNTEIKQRLLYVCQQEHFSNYEMTCDILSKTSHGCMRDALMKLDQCVDYSTDLSLNNIKPILNTLSLSYEGLFRLTWALQNKDETNALAVLSTIAAQSTSLKHFVEIYLEFVIDLAKFNLFNDINLTNIPSYLATTENGIVQHTIKQAPNKDWFNSLVNMLLKLKLEIKWDAFYRSTIEAFLLQFCRQ